MSDSFSRAFTPSMQFIDENGNPLVGGFLCTYKAGTTTPIATLNDNGLPNQVRIPLNELGSPANGVQLDVSKEYKFVLLRADGTTVWTKDHVKAAGVGDVTVEGITELKEGSPNVHVEMSPDGQSALISVDDTSIEIDANLDTESQNPVENRAVAEALNGKVDKVSGATDNNFAGLDSNGNLKDSGKKASDFATTSQGSKADSAIQGVKVNGSALTPDTNKVVDITKSGLGLGNVTNDAQVKRSEMGVANGVATLNSTGKIPTSQIPGSYDDVKEGYLYNGKFYTDSEHTTEIPAYGDKVYVDIPTNKTYRWSGTQYVVIGTDLALGETSSTAYRGDRGKAAYDHISRTDNPHGVSKSQVGLGNVDNTSDATKKANFTGAVEAENTGFATGGDVAAALFELQTSLGLLIDGEAQAREAADAGKVDKVSGKGLSTNDYTTAEKNKLTGIAANAEVNQNAFSNVKVGSTTIAADSKTDTLEIAGGTGIDAAGDTANGKVTLSLNSATQLSLGKADSAVQSVKINGGGELKDASGNVNIPLAVATGSTGAKAGALSADDKKKLNDLGTAASRNVPASGNAGNDEVVLGSDTRLSAGASAVQDVTVDGTSVVNSSKVAVVPNASTSAKGAVQLAGSIGATVASENNKAATEKAVRDAINALDSNKTSTDGTNVQVKVTETDGKIAAVNITTDNTENRNNKVTAWSGTTTDAHYPSEKLVKSSLDGKASSTHTHGNITNDGKIGSTANRVVVTGTSGVVTTADLTTASPTVPTGGTTTSLEFIDTVAQDSKGKISATKKAVTVDSTYSSTGTNPVNGKAIAAAIGGLDSNKTSTDGTNVQVKVTETDGKISAVNVTKDNTENKNNKVSSWQTTPDNTHYPSEKLVKDGLDAKADADKVVAIADARIDRNGTDGWFKIASKEFNSNGTDLKFQWNASALGYVDNPQNVTFFLNLTIGFGSSGENPSIGRFETSPIKKGSIGCDFKAIVNGTVGNATIELWAKVGSRYGSMAIRELQAGNFRGADAKGFLTYASYSPSDAGSSEEPTGNVSKKLTFVYAQEVISSPTKDNLVAMDANGLVKDSGLAKSSVESAISKAGSAIQGVKVNGTTLTPDANKIVTVPLATKSADGAMSAADKTKLDGIAAGAEVNQNAFSNVKVGSTTIAADSKTDTLEIVGSGATTVTPDATKTKLTISSTDQSVTAVGNHYAPVEDSSAEKDASDGAATQLPSSSTGALVQVVTGIKMDAKGHVVGVASKGLWSPDNNTTYTNPKLGHGYASSTAGTSPAFTAAIPNYTLGGGNGGFIAIKFSADVPENATLNVQSTGAKLIYWKNAAITAGVIQSGDTAILTYDGTRYQLLGVDRSVQEMTDQEVTDLINSLT